MSGPWEMKLDELENKHARAIGLLRELENTIGEITYATYKADPAARRLFSIYEKMNSEINELEHPNIPF